MRSLLVPILLSGLAAAPGARADEAVSVRFVAPERYTDAGNRFGSGPALRATLGEIERILRDLGRRSLSADEALRIEVLDIDLAGQMLPSPGTGLFVRVVSDVTPPRFRLRTVLTQRGRTVLSAEEAVSDITFLMRARPGQGGFAYERDLLRDWFQARIVQRRPPPA